MIPMKNALAVLNLNSKYYMKTFIKHFTGMYDAHYPAVSSNAKVVDFRSDTFSLPTEAMRQAIYNAKVGDDTYFEDPTVKALEGKCADTLGKEAACFVPTGTMSNLLAILVHCEKRSSEILSGSKSHILLFEQSGAAQFGGVNIREIPNKDDGTFDIEELKTRIRTKDIHEPTTRLVCVENTHNILGGKVLPLDWLDEVGTFSKAHKIPTHMDGARLFNASIKLNVPVSRIVNNFDTVTFCFSKGLGSPYGAMLSGSDAFISKAKRIRKALGGTGRQIGFMAAAALYSLENMVTRLQEDHDNVQRIANAIREANNPNFMVPDAQHIHTNILIIKLNATKLKADDFAQRLRNVSETDENPVIIKVLPMSESLVRLIVCCNNSNEDVEEAIKKIKTVLKEVQ